MSKCVWLVCLQTCPLRHQTARSVGGSGSERRGGKADLRVRDIPDVVETLEECEPVNEVETLAGVGADVSDDQVDAVCVPADGSVELETIPCML